MVPLDCVKRKVDEVVDRGEYWDGNDSEDFADSYASHTFIKWGRVIIKC